MRRWWPRIGALVLAGALLLYAEQSGRDVTLAEPNTPVWTTAAAEALVACLREAAGEGYVCAEAALADALAKNVLSVKAQVGLTRLYQALLHEAATGDTNLGDYVGAQRAAPLPVFPDSIRTIWRRLEPKDKTYQTLKKALRKAGPGERRTLRANLRRLRKLPRRLPACYVWVNSAESMLYFIDADTLRDSMRVVVGRPNAPTPDICSRLTAVVTHPSWTVPPVALRDDVLPRIQECRDVVNTEGMRIYDAKGRPVRNDTVHWSRYRVTGFPFRIVQAPGPRNPLGRLQFIFPNVEGVYLHDTPHRRAFERPQRAFSSGCLRLERPDTLLSWLVPPAQRLRVDSALMVGRTQVFYLRRPLPVFVQYQTATVRKGRVVYLPDVYGRD